MAGVGLLASWRESLPPRVFKNSNGSGLKFKHRRLENLIHWGMKVWGVFLICGPQRGRCASVIVQLRAGKFRNWHNPTPVWERRKCFFCVLRNTCYCKLLKVLKNWPSASSLSPVSLMPSSSCRTSTHLQWAQTRAVMLMSTQTAKKGVMKPACWCPLWWWLASSLAWCSSFPASPSLWAVCAKTAACATPTCVPATVSGLTSLDLQHIKNTLCFFCRHA